jgi:protein TonB
LKWKRDPEALFKAAATETGTAASIPGTASKAGAGTGLGNGIGSGALASSGSGSGSGVGLNGSNSGQGLGRAEPLPVTRNPQLLYRDTGVYPASARANRESGTVVLHVEILEDGSVGRVKVHASSGFDDLDAAAAAALKNWRFSTYSKNGRADNFWYTVPFSFTLNYD